MSEKVVFPITLEEQVVQPLLMSVSALTLATETVWNIVQMDDVVNSNLANAGSLASSWPRIVWLE